MPEQKSRIDLDQLPPWLAEMDPALRETCHDLNAPQLRDVAARFAQWVPVLLKAANVYEQHQDCFARELRGQWRAGDPVGN